MEYHGEIYVMLTILCGHEFLHCPRSHLVSFDQDKARSSHANEPGTLACASQAACAEERWGSDFSKGRQLLQIFSHMMLLKARGGARMWAESKDESSNMLQRLWLHICDAELYAYFKNLCKGDEFENHLKCDCSAI